MASSTLVLNALSQPSSSSTMMPAEPCPSCGQAFQYPTAEDPTTAAAIAANRRIVDLEAQVKALNDRAAAAADKLADYEDEVRYLRATYARSSQQQQQQGQTRTWSDGTVTTKSPPLPLPLSSPRLSTSNPQSRLASLSALIPGRKRDTAATGNSLANLNSSSPPSLTSISNKSTPSLPLSSPPGAGNAAGLSLQSLQSTLETERTLRLRAESNLSQTQHEIEDLTAQLFGQANEMVANERKARARLEERVKVLETRDLEKRRRLERLEGAVERIERVRKMISS